jgi:hypothetical protein
VATAGALRHAGVSGRARVVPWSPLIPVGHGSLGGSVAL